MKASFIDGPNTWKHNHQHFLIYVNAIQFHLLKTSLAWKNKRVVHLIFSVENVYDNMIMKKNASRPNYNNI